MERDNLQCQSCKCVHDKVHPKQLHSTQHRLIVAVCNRRNKGQTNCSYIDSDLELCTNALVSKSDTRQGTNSGATNLEKLGDSIINRPTPSNGSHN